jgi:hypothetical protein
VADGNEIAEATVRDLLEADAKDRVIAPVATRQIIHSWLPANSHFPCNVGFVGSGPSVV